jgi:hypothetical protein
MGVQNPGCVVEGFFVVSSARMLSLRHKATSSILTVWHADSDAVARCFQADGKVTVTQANGQVCFLRIYYRNKPISVRELEELYGDPQI